MARVSKCFQQFRIGIRIAQRKELSTDVESFNKDLTEAVNQSLKSA